MFVGFVWNYPCNQQISSFAFIQNRVKVTARSSHVFICCCFIVFAICPYSCIPLTPNPRKQVKPERVQTRVRFFHMPHAVGTFASTHVVRIQRTQTILAAYSGNFPELHVWDGGEVHGAVQKVSLSPRTHTSSFLHLGKRA